MTEDHPLHNRLTGLESNFYKVRDRVVEIDKQVSVHDTLLERYGRDLTDMNARTASQFGKIESTLLTIQQGQDELKSEQNYRRGAYMALAWGIGLFCSVAAIAVAIWGVVSKFGL